MNKKAKVLFFVALFSLISVYVSPAHAVDPTGRIDYAISYFPPATGVIMHGGWGPSGNWSPLSEVWKLNTSGWTLLSTTNSPAMSHHSMTYDSGRQVLVVCKPGSGSFQTWEFNGTAWTQKSDTTASINGDVEIAYDSNRQVTVLYGVGTNGSIVTFEYNGTTWTQKSPAHQPVSCSDGALLQYHPLISSTVLVGKASGSSASTQTWTWNGTDWTQVTGTQPGSAIMGGMAYDSARNEMVLLTTDMKTWTFNGTTWTQKAPAASPTPSSNSFFGMAFDAQRQVAVIFGGESGSSYPQKTWQWDGNTWAEFAANSCTYTLSSTSIAYSAQTGTGSFIVTPSAETCAWTAASSASWITVTSGASGTGTVSYSIAANTGAARTGTITAGGQTFTVTQAGWVYANSIGTRNSIKVTDMSGILSTAGGNITVRAWDTNGATIAESGSATALKLYNNGTTTIAGTDLIARFASTTTLYGITADSSKIVITNVKTSSDGTLNVPNGYSSGTTNFVTNSVGSRNSIKITDMSGSLSSSGAAITVKAWDSNGNALTELSTAPALTLANRGTTTISGPDLMARFPSATPMSYEFTVNSSKMVLTNVKSSADGSINIPYSFYVGTTNFVANSVGTRNTIKITDTSGTLSSTGAAITISAWDSNGNALTELSTATPLKLYSRGTTPITGPDLFARFPGSPMAFEFSVASTKYTITNVKASSDASITIPFLYTGGTTTKYATNYVSSKTTIQISDMSGSISGGSGAITVSAWDANGVSIAESGTAVPLTLVNNGTTTIAGSDLIARFPTGTPASYEFTIGSSQYMVTTLTTNNAGTLNVPSIYYSGVAGGI
ncbi:MAG: hypothetical protein CSYNP_03871 [Syntrophus sp. SKADARSKE-3]|nr:hypothetical protein [Syntrophus sp. SKADARSKE-3]